MDIDVDDAPPQLVIYGHITTDTMRHAVTVSRSLNYFENARPEGISHAAVSISTDNETYLLTESPTEKGTYLTAPDVFGIEGKTYTLNVAVESGGVRNEYEASSLLPPSIRMDSVALQPSPLTGYLVDVLLYGRLPESEHNYLNVQAFKNGIAINGKLANFSIIVSENATDKEIYGEQCLYLFKKNDNSELMSQSGGFTPVEDGDSIRIQVSSITKEYADYVLNAQKELQGTMPIFSGPPANVKSNIKAVGPSGESAVCGFFTAYSKRSSSRVYREEK
jgi:hypothetical protein